MALLGLLLAAWTVGAAWMMFAGNAKMRKAESGRKAARRLARMIDEAPAVPLLVRADGKIEAPDRLAGWLGLDNVPEYLSELTSGVDRGLSRAQLDELTEAVRKAQKTASPFRMTLTPPGSSRSLALRGGLADPQISPGGAALVWVFDFSESEGELTRLRGESDRARSDFAALVGLIEAAPMPMWFRGNDGQLRLVNSAYVNAVAAESADTVVSEQTELVEIVEGDSAADVAMQAADQGEAIERNVTATIGGQRRTLRVSDLPLGDEGIAGYAVDIEEMEEQARAFRAFREAQTSMLDQLSVGVATFDNERKLTFTNLPMRRLFALNRKIVQERVVFEDLLVSARDAGLTPEVRDFPAWKDAHVDWFSASEPQEEAWPLRGGKHLRIVGQPMPDGGLVMVAEDRTEQLALSAMRDTLLRTRTATFDSLFESLAVFSPDSHLQLWNRRFAEDWGLEDEFLDAHPLAEDLLKQIAPHLEKPKQVAAIGDVVRVATLDRKQKAGRITLRDGRTVEFAGVPLPDGNGLLTILDITDSQRAEDALRERNQALEAADTVKTNFLANMSYEFRTPLTSIGGFAELLQAGVAGELSDQGQEYVTAILDSVARLGDQVENVLDLSQSEAGLLPLNKTRVELMPMATKVVRSREQIIVNAGISLNLRGTKAAGVVDADERQLARILTHLLDNAVAATPKGGNILIDISRVKGGSRLVVSDDGAGMTPNELAAALGGLRQNDDGGLERRQGLGLPLARQLIEAHGGTLEVVSQKGEGTTAAILLP